MHSKKPLRSREDMVMLLLRLLNEYLKACEDLNHASGTGAQMLTVFQDEVKVRQDRINNFKSCCIVHGYTFIDLYHAAMELRKQTE